jgi:hypothetical protein
MMFKFEIGDFVKIKIRKLDSGPEWIKSTIQSNLSAFDSNDSFKIIDRFHNKTYKENIYKICLRPQNPYTTLSFVDNVYYEIPNKYSSHTTCVNENNIED